jgi:hypothetical protein
MAQNQTIANKMFQFQLNIRKAHFKTHLQIKVFYSLPFWSYLDINAQTETLPKVDFSQRTSSAATPPAVVYNVKGDFTMLG